MKKVIVAGANGFIGNNLTQNLIERGYSVTALVKECSKAIASPSITYILVKNKSIEEIAGELTKKITEMSAQENAREPSKKKLEKKLDGDYSCFYDLAWTGTSGSLRGDYNTQLENVRLTCDYVRLASMLHCPRFIYASSINEMETYEYMQSDDIAPSAGYIYGASKLAAHLLGEVVAYQNAVEFIPVIITNIYGVGEKSARLIYTSITKLLNGEHCSFTEGHQTYDFIYITDAINSIIEVAEKGKAFNRYYIGSGEPKPLREFLLKIRDIVAPTARLGLGDIPFKGVDINYNQFDLKKVSNDTNYKNKVTFEEGIKLTRDWLKNKPPPPKDI